MGSQAGLVGGVIRRFSLENIDSELLPKDRRWLRYCVVVLGLAMSAFHVVVLGVYAVNPWILTTVHFFFASTLVLLLVSPNGGTSGEDWRRVTGRCVSIILIGITAIVAIYILIDYEDLFERSSIEPTHTDIWIGCGLILVVLETTRRTAGTGLPILAAIFFVYGLFGHLIPGVFGHNSIGFSRLVSFLLSPEGIYGVALNASAVYVFLFVLFGALLEICGGSKLFTDLAMAAVGRYRGGPAKVSIVSSLFFGTVSGSSVANVAVTGLVTIPMMKSAGVSGARAGAVEAMSSIGGQFVPPVMGVAAFLMADIMGAPYASICVAGILPSFLYYLSAYFVVDFMAARDRITEVEEATKISVLNVLAKKGHLLIPLGVLIWCLAVISYSPIRSVLYAGLSLIFVSWIRSDTRIDLGTLLRGLYQGAERAINIVPTCAAAGIIVGIFMFTGLGVKLTSILLAFSFGSSLIALLIVMIVTLVLGMGMPTVAAYAIGATVAAPALVELGVSELGAHFFVFYFAVLSGVTPPVALASFTAASIANASMTETSFLSLRYCLAGFIIPFMFVHSPALFLQGDAMIVVLAVISATIGVIALAAAIQGWLFVNVLAWERLTLFIAALNLIWAGLISDIVGYGLVIVVVTSQIMRRRKVHDAKVVDRA